MWADAAGSVGAYQPPVERQRAGRGFVRRPRRSSGPPDWRGLLDLLEEHTGTSFDDLWRTWVARDTDLPLLDDRAAARADYDAVVAQAGDWQLPRTVRDAMRAWQFGQATDLLTGAKAILAQRTAIATPAAAAGLTAPATLETAFEADDGFATAHHRGHVRARRHRALSRCRGRPAHRP